MKRVLAAVMVLVVLVGSGVALAQDAEEPLTVERVHHMLQGLQADFLIVGLEIRGIKNRMSELEEKVTALEHLAGDPKVYELDASCLIVSDGNAVVPMGYELQPATVDAFVDQYGEKPNTATVSRVLLRPGEGVVEVHYHIQMDRTLSGMVAVVETWQGCQHVMTEFGRG